MCKSEIIYRSDKNKLNGIYVYRHKHNYILCSMFPITKAQLHVSAINVGLFRFYMRNLSISYTNVCGEFSLWGGCKILFCVGERGVDWGCLGNSVKVTSMSTYSYVYKWVTF
jgi:hypothetical protein